MFRPVPPPISTKQGNLTREPKIPRRLTPRTRNTPLSLRYWREFCEKSKVNGIMNHNWNKMISRNDSRLMLANFRNVPKHKVNPNDIAIDYLVGRTVYQLRDFIIDLPKLSHANEVITRLNYGDSNPCTPNFTDSSTDSRSATELANTTAPQLVPERAPQSIFQLPTQHIPEEELDYEDITVTCAVQEVAEEEEVENDDLRTVVFDTKPTHVLFPSAMSDTFSKASEATFHVPKWSTSASGITITEFNTRDRKLTYGEGGYETSTVTNKERDNSRLTVPRMRSTSRWTSYSLSPTSFEVSTPFSHSTHSSLYHTPTGSGYSANWSEVGLDLNDEFSDTKTRTNRTQTNKSMVMEPKKNSKPNAPSLSKLGIVLGELDKISEKSATLTVMTPRRQAGNQTFHERDTSDSYNRRNVSMSAHKWIPMSGAATPISPPSDDEEEDGFDIRLIDECLGALHLANFSMDVSAFANRLDLQ